MRLVVAQPLLLLLLVAHPGKVSCQPFTLNVPSVLLPYVPDESGVRTNYTLESRDGCFKWSSSNTRVAIVSPLYESLSAKCSKRAIVTSVWGKPLSQKAVIWAEGEDASVVKCDVFVDTINRIEITTTSRELVQDDMPQRLDVRGFDAKGNVFSSLRGHLFEWTVEPEDQLNFVRFCQSQYHTDPVIEEIEQEEFYGNSVLVQGIKAGVVVVHVKLRDRAWQNVSPDSVNLTINKPDIWFVPYQPVYLIPLSYMDYIVKIRKMDKMEVVPLPSPLYSAQLSNTSVCQLVVEKTRVIGLDYGHSKLYLIDSSNASDRSVPAEISVVQPHRLNFHVTRDNILDFHVTGDNWVLEVGQLYTFTVQLFDHKNNRIFMSENLRLDTVIPRVFFDILDKSLNGSYFSIRPKKSGHSSFSSSFNKLVHPNNGSTVALSTTLTQQQPVDIYGPIVAEQNPVVLLWHASQSRNSHQLHVFGGSGSYDWSLVENNGVISVSTVGVVTILAQGSSSVKVTDQKNSHHFVIIKVYVAPPARLQFVNSTFEVIVGTTLILPIQISAYVNVLPQPMSPTVDCRGIGVNFTTTSQDISSISMDTEVDLSSLPKGACSAIRVVIVRVGRTKVTITLETKGFGRLEATTTIDAHRLITVLLPYVPGESGVRTNYTLQEDGCFKWVSTNTDVAVVTPLYETSSQCSQQVLVTSVWSVARREKTIVRAEEQVTGTVRKQWDVFVDTIQRINIARTSREMRQKEVKMLSIRAFDAKGNEFTSLQGHLFEWTVEPEGILRFIRFSESQYQTNPVIEKIEQEGSRGDSVLVQGIRPGIAVVHVKLLDRAWQDVDSESVEIEVIVDRPDMWFIPYQPVYLIPLSYVDYTVMMKKMDKIEVVPLPSTQYSVQLSNTSVCQLVVEKTRVIGQDYGQSKLYLIDSSYPSDRSVSAEISVVQPFRLSIYVTGGFQVLVVGQLYAITVQLFDHANNRIFMSENLRLDTVIPKDFFDILDKSLNGSYFYIRPKRSGPFSFSSSFSRIVHPDSGIITTFPSTIIWEESIVIYEPIVVEQNPVVFLWHASQGRSSHVLHVFGGSGSYHWSLVENNGVISVSTVGVVTILAQGSSSVKVTDQKDSRHFVIIKVYVAPPERLQFVHSTFEVSVGTTLILPIQISAYINELPQPLLPAVDCRSFGFDVTANHQDISSIFMDTEVELSSLPKGACSAIRVVVARVGRTKVTITLETKVFGRLEATTTIEAYQISIQNEVVLTLGSSHTFVFDGAPMPKAFDPSPVYIYEIKQEVRDKLAVYPVQHVDRQYQFRITCLKLGEVEFNVTIGKAPSHTNPSPVTAQALLYIFCAEPQTFLLRPLTTTNSSCPLLSSGSVFQIPVMANHLFDLNLTVLDQKGRRFSNFSSLDLKLESSGETVVQMPLHMTHYGKHSIISVQPESSAELRVTSQTYARKILAEEKVFVSQQLLFFKAVSARLALLVMKPPILVPSLVILSHPENKQSIAVVGGSGYFEIESISANSSSIANVELSFGTRQILMSPKTEGSFEIHIRDLCLGMGSILTTMIHVSEVHSIDVLFSKIQVNQTITVTVTVRDRMGRPIPSDQLHYIHLQYHTTSAHVTVVPAWKQYLIMFSAQQLRESVVFIVKGVTIGVTTLYFTATLPSGHVVTSIVKEIQVYPPMRWSQRDIWLVTGAEYKIHSSGGTVQTNIVYSVNDSSVVTVDESGLIRALAVGCALVTGRAEEKDSVTEMITLYTEAKLYVHVRQMTGIKIYIPSTQLLAGTEVPVLADGIDDTDTPFTFGDTIPRMTFHWAVTNMDVFSLVSVFAKAGVSLTEEKDFPARIHTHRPGIGEIQLTAVCPPGVCSHNEVTFTDSVEVRVLPPLRLINPSNGYLLLPFDSTAKIQTNRDCNAKMSYQLLYPDQTDPKLIKMEMDGTIHTTNISGHAVVVVTAFESESDYNHEIDGSRDYNQSVVVHVEVRPVASLALTPPPFLPKAMPSSRYYSFTLGFTAHFTFDLHDIKGRMFSRTAKSIQYRLNRVDVIRVLPGNNCSLMIQAVQQGDSILRVWLHGHPHIDDYIRVRVGSAISPNKATVHLGTRIVFSTDFAEDDSGVWSSGDEGVVHMERSSGVGRAVSIGKTVIYYSMPDMADMRAEVSVAKVEEITARPSKHILFTNAEGASNYTVPVEFYAGEGDPFTPLNDDVQMVSYCVDHCKDVAQVLTNTFIQQVSFSCELSLTSSHGAHLDAGRYMKAAAAFNDTTGTYSCALLPGDDKNASSDIATEDGMTLSLQVVASDFAGVYSVRSDPVTVPFVPAFNIAQSSVALCPSGKGANVTVWGTPDHLRQLEVSSSDEEHVKVAQISTDSPSSSLYTVTLMEQPSLNIVGKYILFYSPVTEQKVFIPVSYNTDSACLQDEPGASPLMPILIAMLLVAVGITLTTFRNWKRPGPVGKLLAEKDLASR